MCVCHGLSGRASDSQPFTGKCGNAVLSFPVCNYLKGLAGIGSHNRRPVLHRAAAEGLASRMPLGRSNNVWDSFSVRKSDLKLGVGSSNTAAFLGRSRTSLAACRKERWSHVNAEWLP